MRVARIIALLALCLAASGCAIFRGPPVPPLPPSQTCSDGTIATYPATCPRPPSLPPPPPPPLTRDCPDGSTVPADERCPRVTGTTRTEDLLNALPQAIAGQGSVEFTRVSRAPAGPRPRVSSCEYGDDQRCRVADAHIRDAPRISAFIIVPRSVALNDDFRVRVEVDATRRRSVPLLQRENPDSVIGSRRIPYLLRMKPQLLLPSAMTIVERNDAILPVRTSAPTVWDFTVKATRPIERANIEVQLHASVDVEGQSGSPQPIGERLSAATTVEPMSWGQWIGDSVAWFQPVYAFGATLVGGALGTLAWFRKRAAPKKKPAKPKKKPAPAAA